MAGGMCGRGHVWQGTCVAGDACVVGGMHGRGACMAGRHAWQGGMHGRGVCMTGGMCGRGVHARGHVWQGGVHGRRDSHCSGWYASYWNAFLLLFKSSECKFKVSIANFRIRSYTP